ncbi:MAG: hypothetical protein ACYC4L_02210 [Chloroflexota bacterium]
MTDPSVGQLVERALVDGNGLLRLAPAWVARNTVPPGRRFGLPDSAYDAGERGFISERWLASCTLADNVIGPADEGLSYVALDGETRLTLRDALAAAGPLLLGAELAKTQKTLGYLSKMFDCEDRLPYHFHPMAADAAKVGKNPKEEAYHFPEGVPLGKHPETFFGVHPYIVEESKQEILLPYMVAWQDAAILKHARAYLQVPGEGFHVPSGILHAPGTALTIELQEESDVGMTLQALNAGRILAKERLFRNMRPEDRDAYGERGVLNMIDWESNGDPYFYENRHLSPILSVEQPGGSEHWIFYNSERFSGKKVYVKPGQTFISRDRVAYGLFVWQGSGAIGGQAVTGGLPGQDELLVSHPLATKELRFENVGAEDMIVYKFFGPGVNPDAPRIETRRAHA